MTALLALRDWFAAFVLVGLLMAIIGSFVTWSVWLPTDEMWGRAAWVWLSLIGLINPVTRALEKTKA